MKLETVQVTTPEHTTMVDITELVAKKTSEQGIQSGLCVVYVPHTTAGITINEGADPAVTQDILAHLEKLVPWQANYRHMEGNSAAHIKTSLVGNSVQVIVYRGNLVLGTWQRIFLCEFDGPRTRKVRITWICTD